jgi:hypothetical protein
MHTLNKSCNASYFWGPGVGVHGNNQVRPCSSHVFSTDSKGTTAMQKPGNDAKAFGLSRQVVHKKTVES